MANEEFIKMGQIHHKVMPVSLDDILQTDLILSVSSKTIREETIKEGNIQYKIFIERYVIEECIRGDFDKGTSIEVYASYRTFSSVCKRCNTGNITP